MQKILGISFHDGTLAEALDLSLRGGLVVAPSAPVLAALPGDAAQSEALERSDLALLDSGFLVLLWQLLDGQRLPRLSGLRFFQGLLTLPEFRRPGATFWVLPSSEDAKADLPWLEKRGIAVSSGASYLAPLYGPGKLADRDLLLAIERARPRFVVLNLGGGVQERLGYFLRGSLSYRPTIVCTGAALAFLSGRQANIPAWADRLFLGWLLRCWHDPRKFVLRYWRALRLVPLLVRLGPAAVNGSAP